MMFSNMEKQPTEREERQERLGAISAALVYKEAAQMQEQKYSLFALPYHKDEAVAWYHGNRGWILLDGAPPLAVA